MFYYYLFVKRFFVTILSLVYFVASSGMLLRQHYCMGDLVETQIDFGQIVADNACSDCGMEEAEDSCCESKIKLVKKVQDERSYEAQVLNLADITTDLIPAFFIFTPVHVVLRESVAVVALQKPPPKSIPVFLEIRNLRI